MSSGRSGHGTRFLHLGLRNALTNKTLDISSSFRRLLAESRGHRRLREAFAKLRQSGFKESISEIEINSPVKRHPW